MCYLLLFPKLRETSTLKGGLILVPSCRGFNSCWHHSAENVTVEGEKQRKES